MILLVLGYVLNNDELNEFIAQALKALDNNSILSYDKRISSIIKRYV